MVNKQKYFWLSGILFCLFLISLTLSASFISAYTKDVAYILRHDRNNKTEIIDIFNSLNLTYEIVEDSNVGSKNLANYRMVLVDDGYLRNTRLKQIYNYPSVIMNPYYGFEWGLTDDDGISDLTSTIPLSVRLLNNGIVPVYTRTRYDNGLYIPYFFLDDDNKANLVSVARTWGGEENPFSDVGDVIATADKGTQLINGKTAGGDICFFGISKSPYWTPAARQLFIDCVGSVLIECRNDSDCPSQNIGSRYCSTDGVTVLQNVEEYECENPNTVHSQCVDDLVVNPVEVCEDYCLNGHCEDFECETDSDCDDTNVSTQDICRNASTPSSYCTNEPYPQCSDFVDNDIDTLIDILDPGCHTDGNPSNNFTYNSSDNNESNPPITCNFDSDCGIPFSNLSCNGDYSVNQTITPTCDSPGSIFSYCKNVSTNSSNLCLFGCNSSLGTCILSQCSNGVDDEDIEDVLIDIADHGCHSDWNVSNNASYDLNDNNESNPPITCFNDHPDCEDFNLYTEDICHNKGLPSSYCTNTNITCFTNLDCGVDRSLDDFFCNGPSGEDVYVHFIDFTCHNNGTILSYCSNHTASHLNETCSNGCFNGTCLPEDNPPEILLIFPPNHHNTTNPNVNFVYNVTDESPIANCSLILDGSRVMITSPVFDVTNSFSYSLSLGAHTWKVECTDILGNSGSSETRHITVNEEYIPKHDLEISLAFDPLNTINGIRIRNGSNYFIDNPAILNLSKFSVYEFKSRIDNIGEFNDSYYYRCNITKLGVNIYSWKSSGLLEVSANTYKTEMIDFSGFETGNYVVSCNLTLIGFTDKNNSDNFRARSFELLRDNEIPQEPECSDGIDNADPEDALIDAADPGCHTDGDETNPGTYNSSDDDETDPFIRCHLNSDCGANGYVGNRFCTGSNGLFFINVSQNYINFTCNNPRTIFSSCSNSTSIKLIEECDDYCNQTFGQCRNFTCRIDLDCNDFNTDTIDKCINPATPWSYCNYTNIPEESEICDGSPDEWKSGWQVFAPYMAGACGGYYPICNKNNYGLAWLQETNNVITPAMYTFLCQDNACNMVDGAGMGQRVDVPARGEYYLSLKAGWDPNELDENLYAGVNTFGENSQRRLAHDFNDFTKCVYKHKFNATSDPAKVWVEAAADSGSVHVSEFKLSTCIPANITVYCETGNPVVA